MLLKEEMNKYLHYCKYQKELDDKTIRAYRADLEQFIGFMERYDNFSGKEEINSYLLYIHDLYMQKTVKRKIASVKALFRYLLFFHLPSVIITSTHTHHKQESRSPHDTTSTP